MHVLDTLDLKCPQPVLRIAVRAPDMEPGEVLEVLGNCPTFEKDVCTWCTRLGKVLLSVKDEGVGIAEEELSQLFQPYERTASRKTAGERGTGLGLAIAAKIVEEHGGKIEVQSAVGTGSRSS